MEAAGDLFSLSWSPGLQTIYIGCQDTSLQWYNFRAPATTHDSQSFSSSNDLSTSISGTSTPNAVRKAHKFFDSYPQHERRPADIHANNGTLRSNTPDSDIAPPQASLHVPGSNVIDSAHYGYIYCMALLQELDGGRVQLVTGSGDETVKVRSHLSPRNS